MGKITQTEINQILDEAEIDLLLKSDMDNIEDFVEVTGVNFYTKGQNVIIRGDKEALGIRRIQHYLLYCEKERNCKVHRRNREIVIYIKREEINKFTILSLVELSYMDLKQQ